VAGGPGRRLTPDHPADALRPRYTPDGGTLVYGRREDALFYADRVRLWRLDRATGAHAPWLADWPLSPEGWAFGPDGTLWFDAEEEARASLFALPPPGPGPAPAPRRVHRGGTVGHVAPAGDGRVLFTRASLVDPAEVWRCGVEGTDVTRLTRFTEAAMAGVATGEVTERWFEGAGGETVQMWLVRPVGEPGPGPPPLVHVIHGGPHGSSGDEFHLRWNPHVLGAPGYLVALVNFQGSTSFGQEFARRIQGAWGDRPFEDVMRATDVLAAEGLVDPARMAAAGGSYGGYLVAWIVGHTDRFRCLVNHAGVFDTLADYADDVTQGRGRAFGGEPWEDLAGLDRWNPARYTGAFQTPMLVLHGERDFRVPASLGLQCYGILKARRVPARLVYFPDEHHWILKPRNSLLWYREVLGWLARWLT
jgi:dipeptidyl aminopeptidase/acylaminoacyl peptidase